MTRSCPADAGTILDKPEAPVLLAVGNVSLLANDSLLLDEVAMLLVEG